MSHLNYAHLFGCCPWCCVNKICANAEESKFRFVFFYLSFFFILISLLFLCMLHLFYVDAPVSRDRHVSIYSLLIIFSYGYFCFITKSGLGFESHELLQYMSNTVADVESTWQE